MKFNMGCGRRKMAGFVNVDGWAGCEPDAVFDLETTPWPWPDNCAEEVRFIHSLEHMGQLAPVFLRIIQETWRICSNGALLVIYAPHPKHENFLTDPTHVRAITPAMMQMFDRKLNDEWAASNAANTPLAHHLGVDFELVTQRTLLAEPYFGEFTRGELSTQDVEQLLRSRNNVAKEYQMILRARKD